MYEAYVSDFSSFLYCCHSVELEGDLEQAGGLQLPLDRGGLVGGRGAVVAGRVQAYASSTGVVMPAASSSALALAVSGAPYLSLNDSVWPAMPLPTIEYSGVTVSLYAVLGDAGAVDDLGDGLPHGLLVGRLPLASKTM